MKKFKSKLIAVGTILVTTATIASPVLFMTSCAKTKTNDTSNNNNSTNTDSSENNSNNNSNDSNSGSNNDSSGSDDSTSTTPDTDSNGGNSSDSGSSGSNDNTNTQPDVDNSGSSGNDSSSSDSNTNTGTNNNNNNSSSGNSSGSTNTPGTNNNNQSGNSSNGSTSTPSTSDNFIYDKTYKTATINASKLDLPSNIFEVYQDLFIDGKTNPSILNNLNAKLSSILKTYLKTTDTIDYNNYKLDLSNISSNTWSIELPIKTSNSSLTSIFINFNNSYSDISNLLSENNINVNSGDYFPYTNLATIKNISLTNLTKMLKTPILGDTSAISNNFSFIALDGSKAITNDNVFCFDYSDTNGRCVKYLINNNGKLGLLNIKNSVTNLPKTSLITSKFSNSNKVNLKTIINQNNNFSSLNFKTVPSSSNNSLTLDYATVEKNTSLTSLLSNYLAFENNTLDYEAGLGLDMVHYLNEFFNNLKSKWVSDDLITNENISLYNNLKLSSTSSSTSSGSSSIGSTGGSNIMVDPGIKNDSLGFGPSSFTTNMQAATTSSTTKKLNGSIGFELRNPTSEAVSFNLPINNTEFVVSPSSIVSVVIEFNDSIVKPSLVQDSSAVNTAYLTSSFTNVKMSVSETTFTTDNLVGTISYSDSKKQTYNFGSSAVNITPNSYALKTKVTNVSFGKSILTDTKTINAAYDTYSYDLSSTLRRATEKQLTETYNNMLEAVKSIQSIVVKMSTNPTIYNFLQNLSSEVKNLLTLFTTDEYLPSLVGDLFSTNTTSKYLADNIKNITGFLRANNTSNSSIVKTVIEVLNLVVDSNPTQQNFKSLLAELETYLPLAQTYLPADAQFIIPLLQKIVPSLSADKSILDITFENLDYILDFVISSANKLFINKGVVNVLNSLKTYLKQLLDYSKYTGSSTDANKYKTINIFSVLTNELFAADSTKSLLNLIASFLSLNPNTSSNIADVLSSISTLLSKNIKFKQQIEDYSELKFSNRGLGAFDLKFEWKPSGTPKKVSIADQLGKIFSSLVNVKVGGKTSDLYTALKTNVKKETITDTFSYWSINKTVSQDYTVKYSFIQDVVVDTMPICVLLNNMEDTTNLGLTSDMVSQINMGVNVYISRMLAGRSIPHSQGAGFNITNGKGLGWLFPTDIVIKSKANYLTINYKANEAKVYPTVNKYTGAINFSWNATRNIGIEGSSIWTDSNSAFKSKKIANASWYGCAFGLLTQDLNKLANIFGIQFTKVPFSKVIGGLVNFDGGFTNSTSVTTKLANPYKISNYDANIVNTDYYATQLKSASDIKAFLKTTVEKYGKWTTSSTTKKPEFTVSLPTTFASDLAKYLNISSSYKSNIANYSYSFSGLSYKIPLDGNINNSKSTKQYTFTLKFSVPTIFTTYEEQNVPQMTKLVQSITFSFIIKS